MRDLISVTASLALGLVAMLHASLSDDRRAASVGASPQSMTIEQAAHTFLMSNRRALLSETARGQAVIDQLGAGPLGFQWGILVWQPTPDRLRAVLVTTGSALSDSEAALCVQQLGPHGGFRPHLGDSGYPSDTVIGFGWRQPISAIPLDPGQVMLQI